jgi:hypothetical protein
VSGGETLLTFAQWADGDYRNVYLGELLVAETDLSEAEAETIIAYLGEVDHDFTGKKSKWYSGEIADYYRDRLVRTYERWEDVGEQWIEQHCPNGLLTFMVNAADDIGNKTELHEIIAQVGRKIARNNTANEWWYETRYLVDGLVVAMRRPHVDRAPAAGANAVGTVSF